MKALTLSNEQAQKLERLFLLFPEFNNIDSNIIEYGQKAVISIKLVNGEVMIPYIERIEGIDYVMYNKIHWFEFCLRYLVMAIFPDSIKDCVSISNSIKHYNTIFHWLAGYPKNFISGVDLENFHPVDYLYERFINE